MTFNDIWDIYFNLILISKSKKVIVSTRGRYTLHLKSLIGNLNINDFSTINAIQLKNNLEKTHLSPQSITSCLQIVRRLLNAATNFGFYTGKLPKFEYPKFDNKRMRFLSKEEAQKLFSVLYELSPLWHDISMFALQTGLRLGELQKLSFEHVNFANNYINVVDTKSYKNRQIPLNDVSKTILNKYQDKILSKGKQSPIFF